MVITLLSFVGHFKLITHRFTDFIEKMPMFFFCCTGNKYRILVPFIVLQELDALKNKRSVSIYASAAIRFIYKHIKSAKQRLQGIFERKKYQFFTSIE